MADSGKFDVVVCASALPIGREAYEDVLGDIATVTMLAEIGADERSAALRKADAVIVLAPQAELSEEERAHLDEVRFVQTLSVGVDHIPRGVIPDHVAMGNTAGAAAPAIAEHILAMVLSAAKRLMIEQKHLAEGRFGYGRLNRMLSGGTACLYGYGEIGRETARLLRAFGMRIEAINRSGRRDENVDWVGADADLEACLDRCDLLAVTASLNAATRGRIGADQLARMKPDAILVVASRAAIVDQEALYNHLTDNPGFTACIDTWWREKMALDTPFEQDFPFLELPNVIGSPHNSGLVPGALEGLASSAARNVRNFLTGEGRVALVAEADRTG